jgi:adenine/guanine phosphoribosyltransferase-like PRPP-binding protein
MEDMPLEIARLLLGLLMTALHRRIADFITERERSLVVTFRERGVALPAALSTETGRNLYFWIGIFIIVVELLRIYQMGH